MKPFGRLLDARGRAPKQTLRLVVLALVAWGFTIGNGMYLMSSFENTPGRFGAVPSLWPADSMLPHQAGKATLLFFAHPRCPCTTASLLQLKQILVAAQVPVQCNIVFLTPPEVNRDWTETATVQSAMSLPLANVILDQGDEIRRFGATTSGHALLFDASNQLVYSGGITLSRGQAGDNGGSQSLIRLLNRQTPMLKKAPVFGCPLIQVTPENSSSGDVESCQRS